MLESSLADPQRGLLRKRIAGASVIQFAADQIGTLEAGVLLAKVCLGGEAKVGVVAPEVNQISRPHIGVSTSNPLVDCIGCQYAGWPLAVDDYSAMASGPIRLLRSDKLPTETAVAHIAQQAGVAVENLFICTANTSSLPGSLQVVARSVETAMHKLHEIGFDLRTVQHASGTAPLPPMTDSDLTAMGWTNDAMLFGASVQLTVDTTDEAIAAIIDQVPSSHSPQFGKPFLDVFNDADRDFYKIDPLLFAPAEITIKNPQSGNSFLAGELHLDILQTSFGV